MRRRFLHGLAIEVNLSSHLSILRDNALKNDRIAAPLPECRELIPLTGPSRSPVNSHVSSE